MMPKEKLLVTGSSGLVGSRFLEFYSKEYQIADPDLPDFDITNPKQTRDYLLRFHPWAVLHFAAYTDVGAAEKQRGDKQGSCWQVNVEGTKNLITAAKHEKSVFCYISTDMVFPGSPTDPGSYPEDHLPQTDPDKLTWYGYTKAQAEQSVYDAGGTIVRIIYPVRAKFTPKLDYLRKPLKLFDEGKLYPLFTDQQVSISFIDEICVALRQIINNRLKGIFHVSSPDTASPFELVSYLILKARNQDGVVKPASLKEFLEKSDNPVRYPLYGGLKTEKTQTVLNLKFSQWREIIDQLVDQGIGD